MFVRGRGSVEFGICGGIVGFGLRRWMRRLRLELAFFYMRS